MKANHFPDTLVRDWIDIHAHFHPPESAARQAARLKQMKEYGWQVDSILPWDVDKTLEYMDRTGVSMQFLSNIPKHLDLLKVSNDYGASLVQLHPSRFGFLAALPTDQPIACLEEIYRASRILGADGFAVTCCYNGVYLSDPSLHPIWEELDRRSAVVFAHPDAWRPGTMGRPAPVIEVAFETARTFVDMLYAGVFRKYPNIRFVVAHCGGSLPVLSGRLQTIGLEPWVPNPNAITADELRGQLQKLYLDTAAVCPHGLGPALEMTSPGQIIYGSDCGVPCSTEETMKKNLIALLAYAGLTPSQIQEIGKNALSLFPLAKNRRRDFLSVHEVS